MERNQHFGLALIFLFTPYYPRFKNDYNFMQNMPLISKSSFAEILCKNVKGIRKGTTESEREIKFKNHIP